MPRAYVHLLSSSPVFFSLLLPFFFICSSDYIAPPPPAPNISDSEDVLIDSNRRACEPEQRVRVHTHKYNNHTIIRMYKKRWRCNFVNETPPIDLWWRLTWSKSRARTVYLFIIFFFSILFRQSPQWWIGASVVNIVLVLVLLLPRNMTIYARRQ